MLVRIDFINPPPGGGRRGVQVMLRIAPDDVALIKRASAVLGMSLNEFCKTAVVRSAQRILENDPAPPEAQVVKSGPIDPTKRR